MTDKNTPSYQVCEWLIAAQNRFKNMADAKIDPNGFPAIQEALQHLEKTGQLTVGQVQYIWNRTDSRGAVPDYNHYKGYNKKYGNMTTINLNDLIDSNLVDWQSGRSCIQPQFVKAIAQDTDWQWKMNTLRRKPMTPVQGLFY
jgi:hypothetical protein